MSKLICFEGIDGAGTTTQAKLTCENLEKEGFSTHYIKFPNPNNEIGKLIRRVLNKEVVMSAEAQALLYEADFQDTQAEIFEYMNKKDFVILDRYFYSNLAYAPSKGVDHIWLQMVQSGLAIPNLTIYLDIHHNAGLARVKERGECDLHENADLLMKVRDRYIRLIPMGQRLDANRPINEVNKEVMLLIHKK